jgi:hypothetical protein
MEVSLRRFAEAPGWGGVGGVEFLAVVSGAEEGSGGGWLAATGLREAHPETTVSTETTKTIINANLNVPISEAVCAVGNICELYCWTNLFRGVAAFTGGP